MKDLYSLLKQVIKDEQLLLIIVLLICYFILIAILLTIDYKGLHC